MKAQLAAMVHDDTSWHEPMVCKSYSYVHIVLLSSWSAVDHVGKKGQKRFRVSVKISRIVQHITVPFISLQRLCWRRVCELLVHVLYCLVSSRTNSHVFSFSSDLKQPSYVFGGTRQRVQHYSKLSFDRHATCPHHELSLYVALMFGVVGIDRKNA